MVQGLQIGGTSAHFPKFVIHLGNAFYELRKAMGTSSVNDSSTAFRSEVPERARCVWCRDFRSAVLVPTFRSSSYISATLFTNFGKPWALAVLMILVPLFDLKSLKELAAYGAGTSDRRY